MLHFFIIIFYLQNSYIVSMKKYLQIKNILKFESFLIPIFKLSQKLTFQIKFTIYINLKRYIFFIYMIHCTIKY